MNRILLFLSLLITFSCQKHERFDIDTSSIEANYGIKRFENDFFSSKSLDELRKEYPRLLPIQVSDEVFIEDRKDTVLTKLVNEVKDKFSDISELNSQISEMIKRVKFYYPNFKVNKIITLINNPNQNNKAMYIDGLILIPLESYLGSNSEYYLGFDRYLRKNKNREQIISDISESIASYIIPSEHMDSRFINLLAYEGKKMILKDAFLKNVNDSIKIGYSQSELNWVELNEFKMWNYFMEKEMLFNSSNDYQRRFIDDAPFSKFYTDNDLEIPARVGVWQGWQMMRNYFEKNPSIKLQDVINEIDSEKLYYDSKYKPKKK